MDVFLKKILDRVDGLSALMLLDFEGVLIAKANSPGFDPKCDLATTFALSIDQIRKLSLGKTNRIISYFDEYVIYHLNATPLLITFVGEPHLNVGLIRNLEASIIQSCSHLIETMESH